MMGTHNDILNLPSDLKQLDYWQLQHVMLILVGTPPSSNLLYQNCVTN